MKLIIEENDLLDGRYIELYAGGASIAWELLFAEYVREVHINDIDSTVMAFWVACTELTDDLCRLICDTRVNIEEWNRQREIHEHHNQYSTLEVGFSTFFLNRTNRSGILSGGMIGGKTQTGAWKLDARFNKADLIERIERIARYRKRIKLYNFDAMNFIDRVLLDLPSQALVYLDPPYYNKSQDLYCNRYNQGDHQYLAKKVSQQIRQPWIVSYDDVEEIRRLYEQYRNVEYNINYSAQTRYGGSEVLFYSEQLNVPHVDNPVTVKIGRRREGRRQG